ncbi:MAG: hypothetical protein AMK69_09010 [Nitrospira bacterium SG8_3]|nr:MAG: hypothetical protein AMK69_09010 [Nitrospira bacterium SG8_3]
MRWEGLTRKLRSNYQLQLPKKEKIGRFMKSRLKKQWLSKNDETKNGNQAKTASPVKFEGHSSP